tara:strand:+ start:920 stop:1414 length:495 start_codon:yes stop_codon:yes gene_type:complete
MNNHSRLNRKHNHQIFKDDDYETPSNILEDLLPYIPEGIIYDPFYCNGEVIKEWSKLNRICINEKKDAFNREAPKFDVLISNIPFSQKKKSLELAFQLNTPFALLMPIDVLGSLWINKYFNKLKFIIPHKRYNFLKKGQKTAGSWFDTMWVCYNLKLKHKIIKL